VWDVCVCVCGGPLSLSVCPSLMCMCVGCVCVCVGGGGGVWIPLVRVCRHVEDVRIFVRDIYRRIPQRDVVANLGFATS
jgi:hypothetical protein